MYIMGIFLFQARSRVATDATRRPMFLAVSMDTRSAFGNGPKTKNDTGPV
jgi:hypothetical protein